MICPSLFFFFFPFCVVYANGHQVHPGGSSQPDRTVNQVCSFEVVGGRLLSYFFNRRTGQCSGFCGVPHILKVSIQQFDFDLAYPCAQ